MIKHSVHAQLQHLFNHGCLKGTGNLLIYPVDQGVERGPLQCFLQNPDTFDPFYHAELAVSMGASAYAAPLGALEIIAGQFQEKVPLILKMNTSNRLYPGEPNQAMTACIGDALRLGCIGVGLTIYPGSDASLKMLERAQSVIYEAKERGLLTIIWSYARGRNLTTEDETALDVICYAAHIAAQLGPDIIKVKLPSEHIYDRSLSLSVTDLSERVRLVMKSALNRFVLFSGGEAKSYQSVLDDVKAISKGGGTGSIMGRNLFQRPKEDALKLCSEILAIYKEGNNFLTVSKR